MSRYEPGPPDHTGRCRPWHWCDWCPCALDEVQTHDAGSHDRLAQRATSTMSDRPGRKTSPAPPGDEHDPDPVNATATTDENEIEEN